MRNNWPETVDELLAECEELEGRDLYTLGEKGEPFYGEDEPRVDGTDYLAGEYQYGVMMIPAQWVTHVIPEATLGRGTLSASQVSNIVYAHSIHADCADADWQAIADELNNTLGSCNCTNSERTSDERGTCQLERADWDDGTCTWGCICSACDAHLEHETGIGYNYCPICGAKVVSA